jgi:PBP1b-binding outer membrane lipoprotein LpoB
MKKFAMLALLLSLGVFATGCNKPADKKTDAPPAMDGAPPPTDTPPVTTPADTAPAEPAK